jgi:hypothetical protein
VIDYCEPDSRRTSYVHITLAGMHMYGSVALQTFLDHTALPNMGDRSDTNGATLRKRRRSTLLGRLHRYNVRVRATGHWEVEDRIRLVILLRIQGCLMLRHNTYLMCRSITRTDGKLFWAPLGGILAEMR